MKNAIVVLFVLGLAGVTTLSNENQSVPLFDSTGGASEQLNLDGSIDESGGASLSRASKSNLFDDDWFEGLFGEDEHEVEDEYEVEDEDEYEDEDHEDEDDD